MEITERKSEGQDMIEELLHQKNILLRKQKWVSQKIRMVNFRLALERERLEIAEDAQNKIKKAPPLR